MSRDPSSTGQVTSWMHQSWSGHHSRGTCHWAWNHITEWKLRVVIRHKKICLAVYDKICNKSVPTICQTREVVSCGTRGSRGWARGTSWHVAHLRTSTSMSRLIQYQNTHERARRRILKRGCIEFKYYADGIHSGLTPPGNNSWPAGLTKAELSPTVCTPLSPTLFTPHQILYRASLIIDSLVGFVLLSQSLSTETCWHDDPVATQDNAAICHKLVAIGP